MPNGWNMDQNQTNFLSGPNAPFIEELYANYLADPMSVDASWRGFFEDLKEEAQAALKDIKGASWAPRDRGIEIARNGTNGAVNGAHDEGNGALASDSFRVGTGSLTAADRRLAARDSLRTSTVSRRIRNPRSGAVRNA